MTETDDVDAYSVIEFCRRHRISEPFFYKLLKQGKAPEIMRVGTRILISKEAAAAWREAMQVKAAPSRR